VWKTHHPILLSKFFLTGHHKIASFTAFLVHSCILDSKPRRKDLRHDAIKNKTSSVLSRMLECSLQDGGNKEAQDILIWVSSCTKLLCSDDWANNESASEENGDDFAVDEVFVSLRHPEIEPIDVSLLPPGVELPPMPAAVRIKDTVLSQHQILFIRVLNHALEMDKSLQTIQLQRPFLKLLVGTLRVNSKGERFFYCTISSRCHSRISLFVFGCFCHVSSLRENFQLALVISDIYFCDRSDIGPDASRNDEMMLQWETVRTILMLLCTLSARLVMSIFSLRILFYFIFYFLDMSRYDQYQQDLTNAGLLEVILDILIQHEVLSTQGRVPTAPTFSSLDQEDCRESWKHTSHWFFFGLLSDVVRVVANMVYRNKPNQNLVREKNCLAYVLSHCRFDDMNPHVREWAIFAVSNLMLDNQGNQDVLKSMGFVDVAENEKLAEIGLKATVDKETKNIRIEKL
jgi:hypothetical protein